jgi:hypothetical protein
MKVNDNDGRLFIGKILEELIDRPKRAIEVTYECAPYKVDYHGLSLDKVAVTGDSLWIVKWA